MNNMSFGKKSVIFLLAALAPALRAQTADQPIAEVSMNELRVQSVAADSVVFGGRILIRSKERAEVQRISFRDVTLAGAPVFLGNFEQKFEIAANQLTALPGELQVTAYFRDATPDVLERALASNEVRIEGTANILVDLNFFQSVALRRRSVPSELHFNGGTPLSFPGGALSRDAALLAIRAARPFWPVVSTVASTMAKTAASTIANGNHDTVPGAGWTDQLARQYSGSLVWVVSTWQMRDKSGQIYPFDYSCVGFRISPTEIVVPKEAIRPWEFDPRAAAIAKNRKAQVISDGTDVIVFLAGTRMEGPGSRPLNGLRLSRRDVRLVREGSADTETTIVSDGSKRNKASLDRRVSTKNFALLELAEPARGAAQPVSSSIESERPYWDKLAVFRSKIGAGGEVGFEALEVRGHRDGNRLVLESPVDRTAIGSPVVIPAGMLGLLQDERGGSMLRDTLSANNYASSSL